MNTEIEDRRDEQQFLADFDRETDRLLGDADHVMQLMKLEADVERRSAANVKSRVKLAANRRKSKGVFERKGWSAQPSMRLSAKT